MKTLKGINLLFNFFFQFPTLLNTETLGNSENPNSEYKLTLTNTMVDTVI